MMARAGDRNRAAGLPGGQGERQEPSAGVSFAEERAVPERSHGQPGERAICRRRTISRRVIHDQIDTTVEAQMPLGLSGAGGMDGGGGPAGAARRGDGADWPSRWTGVRNVPLLQHQIRAASPQEGHVAVNFDAQLVKEKIAIPAGQYWVPLKQRRARLIFRCWSRRRRIHWRAGA